MKSNDERQEPKRHKRRISEEDVIEIHDTIVREPEIKQEPNGNNTINLNKQSSTGQAMEMERNKFEEDLEKISQQKAFNIKVFERNHQTMIELDEREARLKQKEIELDEREIKLGNLKLVVNSLTAHLCLSHFILVKISFRRK